MRHIKTGESTLRADIAERPLYGSAAKMLNTSSHKLDDGIDRWSTGPFGCHRFKSTRQPSLRQHPRPLHCGLGNIQSRGDLQCGKTGENSQLHYFGLPFVHSGHCSVPDPPKSNPRQLPDRPGYRRLVPPGRHRNASWSCGGAH